MVLLGLARTSCVKSESNIPGDGAEGTIGSCFEAIRDLLTSGLRPALGQRFKRRLRVSKGDEIDPRT